MANEIKTQIGNLEIELKDTYMQGSDLRYATFKVTSLVSKAKAVTRRGKKTEPSVNLEYRPSSPKALEYLSFYGDGRVTKSIKKAIVAMGPNLFCMLLDDLIHLGQREVFTVVFDEGGRKTIDKAKRVILGRERLLPSEFLSYEAAQSFNGTLPVPELSFNLIGIGEADFDVEHAVTLTTIDKTAVDRGNKQDPRDYARGISEKVSKDLDSIRRACSSLLYNYIEQYDKQMTKRTDELFREADGITTRSSEKTNE